MPGEDTRFLAEVPGPGSHGWQVPSLRPVLPPAGTRGPASCLRGDPGLARLRAPGHPGRRAEEQEQGVCTICLPGDLLGGRRVAAS